MAATAPTAATLNFGDGEHGQLIKAVVESFTAQFAPRARLLYLGDEARREMHLDAAAFAALGIHVPRRGSLADVVLHDAERNWLLLVDAVGSHRPLRLNRGAGLARQLRGACAGQVFVSAFPNRSALARFVAHIALNNKVWIADEPSHLIHFDGQRLLGPDAGPDAG